jgi:hypothetical protein
VHYGVPVHTEPQSKEHTMQVLCTTKQATSQVLLLLMAAGHWPLQVHGSSPEKSLSPPFIIILHKPLDATLRTHIEQIPNTQVVD